MTQVFFTGTWKDDTSYENGGCREQFNVRHFSQEEKQGICKSFPEIVCYSFPVD